MSIERLEAELRTLRVDWPETPDLSVAVLARLEGGRSAPPDRAAPSGRSAPLPRRGRLAGLLWRPGLAYGLAAVVAGFAIVMAASPSARSSVLEFLGLRSVKIERREPVATPRPASRLGSDLGLGTATPLAEVREQVSFEVLVPASVGHPDVVYLGALPVAGDAVHLVYGDSTGIPTSENTGASLLISEFPATVGPLIEKTIGSGARLTRLTIDGAPAYFLEGSHGFAYSDSDGRDGAFEAPRLAGNTLLVERSDGLLVRVEGEISQERAVEIARSLR